jgi:hypothetical protein
MIPRIFALMANFCKITVILGLFALAFLPVACNQCTTGTGNAQKEDRLVPEFSAIDLQCSANVIIRDRVLSEDNKVVVEAQSNLLPLISTRVNGETLEIDMKGCVNSSKTITVYVHVNEINEITLSGSGNIETTNRLGGNEMDVNLDGSGNLNLGVKTNKIQVNHRGSGNINLDGNANFIVVEHDGSGDIDAMSLKSSDAEVNLNGSGTVSVFGNRNMKLALNGSGSIFYGGKPQTLNTTNNGSGEIHEAQ